MSVSDGARSSRSHSRKSADTRERILRAATMEFSQYGFAGARTERIVKRAKSNPRMISHHYGGKSGLYLAVLEDALSDLRHEELKIDLEDTAPLDGLLHLFDFMGRHFASNRHLVQLLTYENIQKARHLKKSTAVREMGSPVLQLVSKLLRAGEADGTVRANLDPLQTYVLMVALNQFHLSNGHTLSTIFNVDLAGEDWQEQHRKLARVMVHKMLCPDM